MRFPDCHWRAGGPANGYRCKSPICGPDKPVDLRVCTECQYVNHFDTNAPPRAKSVLSMARSDGGPVPVRVVKVSAGEGYFQGSIIEYAGKLLLGVRYGWFASGFRMMELGEDLQPRDVWDVPIHHKYARAGVEDPRLFIFRGRLFVSCSVLDHPTIGNELHLRSTILVARLSPDLRSAEDVWAPEYAERTLIEKNWMFFEHDQSLMCVYQAQPHKVLRMDAMYASPVHHTAPGMLWKYGHFRGGAPPVLVGEEFYHWFHGQRVTVGASTKDTIYTCGLYTFEARPPFRAMRFSPLPMLLPAEGEFAPSIEGETLQVVFPCGAILRDGQWLVSYGYNDRECRIAEFKAETVEKYLKPLEVKPVCGRKKMDASTRRR